MSSLVLNSHSGLQLEYSNSMLYVNVNSSTKDLELYKRAVLQSFMGKSEKEIFYFYTNSEPEIICRKYSISINNIQATQIISRNENEKFLVKERKIRKKINVQMGSDLYESMMTGCFLSISDSLFVNEKSDDDSLGKEKRSFFSHPSKNLIVLVNNGKIIKSAYAESPFAQKNSFPDRLDVNVFVDTARRLRLIDK